MNVSKLTQGQQTLFIDQYGQPVWAKTLKELKDKAGPGAVNKQYVDTRDGRTFHNGYVIGQRWFTAFRPVEIEQ